MNFKQFWENEILNYNRGWSWESGEVEVFIDCNAILIELKRDRIKEEKEGFRGNMTNYPQKEKISEWNICGRKKKWFLNRV